jgi:hypothetical protein
MGPPVRSTPMARGPISRGHGGDDGGCSARHRDAGREQAADTQRSGDGPGTPGARCQPSARRRHWRSEPEWHCCTWRSPPSVSSTRAPKRGLQHSGLIALSACCSPLGGKCLHFATRRRRPSPRCNSARRRPILTMDHRPQHCRGGLRSPVAVPAPRRAGLVEGLLHREGDFGEGLVAAGLDGQHLGLVFGATLEELRGNPKTPGPGR